MKRRPLTAEEKADAERLNAIWNAYKADHKGATQTWLAAEAGLGTQGAVGQYLRGVIPLNLDALIALTRVLKVKPEEISPRLANRLISVRETSASMFGHSKVAEGYSLKVGEHRVEEPPPGYYNAEAARITGKLPLISWVQAGEWSEIVDNFQPGHAEDWIPCPFTHGEYAFILRVAGASMYNPGGDKSYAPGEFIAVDPSREAQNKSMVVVRTDQEDTATFKQLLIEPDGTYLLQALNPNWPNRIMAMPKDAKIVGVVIGKWVPE